jgi:hypothetical protein
MFDFFQRHPIISAVIGVVVFYVVYRMMSGGGSSTATVPVYSGTDPNAVAAASGLAQAQMQLAAQNHQADLAAEASNTQIAGQVAIATLGQQLGLAQIGAERDISLATTSAARDVAGMQAESTNLASTLAAQVQTAGINAQTEQAAIAAHTTELQTQMMAQMNEANQQTLRTSIEQQGETTRYQIKKQDSGWCFLTTAACDVMGREDDCDELQTLRFYRDGWLRENYPEDIARYYDRAPWIVAKLADHPNHDAIYQTAWHSFIVPAVLCIKQGHNVAAYAIYASLFRTMHTFAIESVAKSAKRVKAPTVVNYEQQELSE